MSTRKRLAWPGWARDKHEGRRRTLANPGTMEAVSAMTAAAASSPLSFPCGEGPGLGKASLVTPGVMWLRIPLPTGSQVVNAWAVRDGAGWAIFDTGMHAEAAVEAWRALCAPDGPLGGPPTRVFCTHLHADHIGMAGWLCREYGVELWMTRAEYQQARILFADSDRETPQEVLDFYRHAGWGDEARTHYRPLGRFTAPLPEGYRRLQDGQRIRLGDHMWHVLTGNGHSPEHACFHCPELALLISGDQVLPKVSSNVSVTHMEPHADPLQDWLTSIGKLRARIPDDVLVLPAHNEPFRGLHHRLDRLTEKRHCALASLRTCLSEAPRRAIDTFEALFGRAEMGAPFKTQLAIGEGLAYLNYLVERGEAFITQDGNGVLWYSRTAAAHSSLE